MPKLLHRTPKLCRKVDGRAFVTIDGRQIMLGKFGELDAQERYDRVVAEWLANGRRMPIAAPKAAPVTISIIVNEYRRHANATLTKPAASVVWLAIKRVWELYGSTPASDFGPLKLKAVRNGWIEKRLCRSTIHGYVQRIRRMFKWAASNELLPASVWQTLATVEGIARGETKAKEPRKVRPIEDAKVDAVQPHVSRQVWALIQLQRLTGARGGELFPIRAMDIDRSQHEVDRVWLYRPAKHKTEHHGIDRVILFGPQAQSVLAPFLNDRAADEPLFSPREAVRELRRRKAKGSRRPGQLPNTKTTERTVGKTYDRNSYCRAIQRATERAFPLPEHMRNVKGDTPSQQKQKRADAITWRKSHQWHPHQLRHNHATMIRRQAGIEIAQIALGHQKPDTTLIYAERDLGRLVEVVAEFC